MNEPEITETGIPGLLIIRPKVFRDERGYFFESYNKKLLEKAGIDITFVQDNQSRSSYGIVRGLHYQLDPYAQTKLLRVLEGRILDVAVDLRRNSPAWGTWFAEEISAENRAQMFIPKGFAHGFSVLSEQATILYKCDEFYHPEAERGIHFADPDLGIEWEVPSGMIRYSDKDGRLPPMKDAEMNFEYEPSNQKPGS